MLQTWEIGNGLPTFFNKINKINIDYLHLLYGKSGRTETSGCMKVRKKMDYSLQTLSKTTLRSWMIWVELYLRNEEPWSDGRCRGIHVSSKILMLYIKNKKRGHVLVLLLGIY